MTRPRPRSFRLATAVIPLTRSKVKAIEKAMDFYYPYDVWARIICEIFQEQKLTKRGISIVISIGKPQKELKNEEQCRNKMKSMEHGIL